MDQEMKLRSIKGVLSKIQDRLVLANPESSSKDFSEEDITFSALCLLDATLANPNLPAGKGE